MRAFKRWKADWSERDPLSGIILLAAISVLALATIWLPGVLALN